MISAHRHRRQRLLLLCTTSCVICAAWLMSSTVRADDQPVYEERHRWLGVQMDLGAPDGIAIGAVIRPYFNWIRLTVSATHALAAGYRGGITLDPMPYPVGLTATAEAGHTTDGEIPGGTGVPAFSYDYANLHMGFEIGIRNHWRVFLHGGGTWIKAKTRGITDTLASDGVTLEEATVTAKMAPTGKLGFTVYF